MGRTSSTNIPIPAHSPRLDLRDNSDPPTLLSIAQGIDPDSMRAIVGSAQEPALNFAESPHSVAQGWDNPGDQVISSSASPGVSGVIRVPYDRSQFKNHSDYGNTTSNVMFAFTHSLKANENTPQRGSRQINSYESKLSFLIDENRSPPSPPTNYKALLHHTKTDPEIRPPSPTKPNTRRGRTVSVGPGWLHNRVSATDKVPGNVAFTDKDGASSAPKRWNLLNKEEAERITVMRHFQSLFFDLIR